MRYDVIHRFIANPLNWTFGSFKWLDGSYTVGLGPFGEIDLIVKSK